jgi:hypothetical protein
MWRAVAERLNEPASSLASQLPQVYLPLTILWPLKILVGAGLPAMRPMASTHFLCLKMQNANPKVGVLFSSSEV